jgi:hypothetical protein
MPQVYCVLARFTLAARQEKEDNVRRIMNNIWEGCISSSPTIVALEIRGVYALVVVEGIRLQITCTSSAKHRSFITWALVDSTPLHLFGIMFRIVTLPFVS